MSEGKREGKEREGNRKKEKKVIGFERERGREEKVNEREKERGRKETKEKELKRKC